MMATSKQDLKQKAQERAAESAGLAAGKPGARPAEKKAPNPEIEGVGPAKNAKTIKLSRLVPDPNQPRKEFRPESLESLAASLVADGQIQPIRVRYDPTEKVYVVVTGGRRLAAARLANLESLECVVETRVMTRSARLVIQAIENEEREALSDIELANAVVEVMEAEGLKQREAAARFRIHETKVARLLTLVELPARVQELVHEGKLAPAVAYNLNKLDADADKEEVAERIAGEGMSRDEANREINLLASQRSDEADDDEEAVRAEEGAIADEEAEALGQAEGGPAPGSRGTAVLDAKKAKAGAKGKAVKAKPKAAGKKKLRTAWPFSAQGFKVYVERAKGLSAGEVVTALELALAEARTELANAN